MTKQGDRVELISTQDEFTMLKPGAKGTVTYVDVLGTIHVKWEGGSTLGLVPGEDSWKVINQKQA
jgi:Domain of unknown function (DUF4314)